eukprot:SAG11_NODE_15514_length_575_cov_2.397059_1_plen_64_part_01
MTELDTLHTPVCSDSDNSVLTVSTPQTRSKIAEKQRSTRQSTSGETFHVPAFAVGADRPAFRPI